MLTQIAHYLNKHLRRAVLLLIVGVVASTSLATAYSTSVGASEVVDSSSTAATTYTWKDRQSISVTGGSVKSGQVLNVDAKDDNPKSGSGTITITEKLTVKDCALWVFCSNSETTWECFVTMGITLTSNLKQGTLSAVPSSIPSAGNSGGPTSCTQKAYDAYNGKVVSIGGTRPSSTTTTAETDNQKIVFFYIYSSLSGADAPASVLLKITGTASKQLTVNKSSGSYPFLNGDIGYAASTTLEPGTYSASVSSPPTGVTKSTKSFTKIKFSQATVHIGDDIEGFGSRQIEVAIEIKTQDPSAQTYGPLDLTLYDANGGTVGTGTTNSVPTDAVTEGQLTERVVNLTGTLDDINAGTYKLCVGKGQGLCQEVIKEEGNKKQVAFQTTGDAVLGSTTAEKKTDCAIDGIGWIVCGVMRAMATFNDLMYGAVEGILLTAPLQTYQADGVTPTPQYSVWRAIRDISNIVLVAIFLIIIFSQATSIGISSYGVKKMLPRIIIAAIAVNLSYFVMQIAVDAANLIGVGLHSFVGGVADQAFSAAEVSWTSITEEILTNTLASATAGTIIVGFVIPAGGFSATALGLIALPFIAGAVLALIAAFVTLFLRNAFIIMLVIIAPLAFAAYLLPNTEDLFTKWRKMFISMLMLFPTAAILFAGSKLAAYVIMGSRSGFEMFFALVIMVMPLFMLPWLARSGGGLLKVVADRLQSMAKSAKAPLQKALKPYVENQQEKYRSGRGGFFTPFNRQRALDKDGNAIKKNGTPYKKNLTQRWTNARKDLEQQTKNDADRVERNWEQRAIDNPTGKTAQRIADKEDLHKRATSIEKQLGLHESHRIASDPNSNARAYADTISDAGKEQKELDEAEKKRLNQRSLPDPVTGQSARSTISGRRLAEIERGGVTNEAIAKASELKINRNARQNNGDLDRAVVSQKVTQTQIDAIEGRQQSMYDTNKTVMGSEAQVAEQEKDFYVRKSASSNAESTEINERIADANDELQAADARKFAAEKRTQAITDRHKAEDEARLTPDGDLADVQAEIDNSSVATEEQKGRQAEELARRKRIANAEGGLREQADRIFDTEKRTQKFNDQKKAREERRLTQPEAEGGLAALQAEIDRANIDAENAKNKQASTKEASKLPGGPNEDLFAESIIGKVASAKTTAEQERIENEARLGFNQQNPDGPGTLFTEEEIKEIKAADQDTQAAQAASTWASGAKGVAYAKEIDDGTDRGIDLAVAASGAAVKNTDGSQKYNDDGTRKIDVLAEAKAARVVLEDKEGDRKNIVSKARSRKMKNDEALRQLGIDMDGNVTDPTALDKLTSAQAVGFIEYAAERGDRQTGMALVSTVSHMREQAIEARKNLEARRDAGESISQEDENEVTRRETDAEDAQALLAKSDSLPPWMGGSDRQKLAEGRFDLTNEEAAVAAVAGGKLTGEAFANMDINNRVAFVKALESMSPEDMAKMKKAAAVNMASDDGAIIAKNPDGTTVEDSAGNPLDTSGNPVDLTQYLDQVDTNFAQTITKVNKAQNDHRLNSRLATRDIEQYNKTRELLLRLSNGKQPKPDPTDPATNTPPPTP